MNCERHKTIKEPCFVCQLDDRTLVEPVLRQLFSTATPRYRYWRIKRTAGKSERTFEYTTETADGGKYWAVERRWVRVQGGERGKIVRKVGFKQRKTAKARALKWYETAVG